MDNNEFNEEMDTLTLTLEDNTELECGVIGVFEANGKEYIALLPLDDDENETVLIYEYSENGDDVDLSLIESDEEFEAVSKVFYELYDEEDEDECGCGCEDHDHN